MEHARNLSSTHLDWSRSYVNKYRGQEYTSDSTARILSDSDSLLDEEAWAFVLANHRSSAYEQPGLWKQRVTALAIHTKHHEAANSTRECLGTPWPPRFDVGIQTHTLHGLDTLWPPKCKLQNLI
nr:hypothetical protein CFP56_52171 [Quercus suber]